MVAKDKDGKSVAAPGLILSSLEEVRRFRKCTSKLKLKKEIQEHSKIKATINSIEDFSKPG